MTRVDFYLLSSHTASNRYQFACRLLEKAYRLGNRIHLLTANEDESRILDNLLWTFRAGSFIPHEIIQADSAPDETTPVLLSHRENFPSPAEVLINLSIEAPEISAEYKRIAEIIDEDKLVKQAGRQRYSYYKQQQLLLETHHLNTVQ